MATSTVPEPGDTPAAVSQLCEKCSVLSFNDAELGYEKDGVFEPHAEWDLRLRYDQRDTLPDLPALKASASAGCGFCAALREATLGLQLGGVSEVSYGLFFEWGIRRGGFENIGLHLLEVTLIPTVEDHNIDRQGRSHQILFTVDSEDQTCRDWLRLLPSPKPHALSKSNVDTVKEALSYCEHECGCDTLRTPGFSPTRLLDLEAWESSDSIKLVETSQLTSASAIRYAALSYCWGPKDEAASQLRTTAETLNSHLNRIHADSLTPVIKDAVETSRALSLRYLWIDALCIIQENHQDWTRESERMDLVYVNAYCTICALASSTCLKGFLERGSPVVVEFASAIRPDIVGRFNLRHLPQSKGTWASSGGNPFEVEMGIATWRQRGWTHQEEYLSARKVLFGHSRMFYSCSKRLWTEPSNYQSVTTSDTFARILQEYQENSDLVNLYRSWCDLLRSYTQRQLTIPGDVLPAISGLAKRLAQVTGDEYLAGLWRSDLTRQLLWESSGPCHATLPEFLNTLMSNKHTNYIYGCPTWSCIWQAGNPLYKGVSYDYFFLHGSDFRPEAKILDVCTTPEDPVLNPWGRIKSAYLEIEARYIDVEDEMWRETHTNFYQIVFGTGDDARHMQCLLDFAPTSPQELHHHNLVVVLLASTTCPYPHEDVSDRYSSNGQSESGSAQTLNSPSTADEFANTGDNEVITEYNIEDSDASVEKDQIASVARSISGELGRETKDNAGLEDTAIDTGASFMPREDDSIGDDNVEKDGAPEPVRSNYGLLLYRLPDERYIRVGWFLSSTDPGVLAVFEDSQTQVFTII